MKRNAILAAVLLLGLAVTLLPGCGDKDDQITGDNNILGDTSSPEFQFVDQFLGGDPMDLTGHSFELTMSLFELIPPAGISGRGRVPAALAVSEDVLIIQGHTYNYAGGWHIFTFEAVVFDSFYQDTVVDVAGIDSFQVLVDGIPVQIPDSNFTGLNVRTHYNWSDRLWSESGASHHSLSINEHVVGADTLMMVNGSAHDSVSIDSLDEQGQCSLDLAVNQTLSNLMMALDSASCPTSGTLTSSVSIDLACQGIGADYESLNVNGTWTMSATIDGDNITVSFSDGTTTWTTTETCGGTDGVRAGPSRSWGLGRR